MRDGKRTPWTFIVEDPSGNSFVQNPNAPAKDEHCKFDRFVRTAEMYQLMGYSAEQSTLTATEDLAKQE
jgi:zinc finger protein